MAEHEVMHYSHPQVTRFTACGGLFAEPGYGSVTKNPDQVTCGLCKPFADGTADPAPILNDARLLDWAANAVRVALPGWLHPESDDAQQHHYRLSDEGANGNEVRLAAHLMCTGHPETLIGKYRVAVTVERV